MLSLCEAVNTKEPCVVVFEICFCTKCEFISGVRNYSNYLGPWATGRDRQEEEPGPGQAARLVIRVWAGEVQGGVHRVASALGPMHLNTSSAQAPPEVSSCPHLYDRALALPFLQANKKSPIMQTRRLTHKLLTWLQDESPPLQHGTFQCNKGASYVVL